MLDWIYPGNFKAKHEEIKSKRVPESGKWFLESPEYQNWLSTTETPAKLYCPGLAGAGKTVLTYFSLFFNRVY